MFDVYPSYILSFEYVTYSKIFRKESHVAFIPFYDLFYVKYLSSYSKCQGQQILQSIIFIFKNHQRNHLYFLFHAVIFFDLSSSFCDTDSVILQ